MEDAHHIESIRICRDAFIRLNYNNKIRPASIQKNFVLLYIRMQLTRTENIEERISKALYIIKNNVTFFTCLFKHVDTVYTVIEYLKFAHNLLTKKRDYNLFFPILFTLFDICNNPQVNLFLLQTLIMQTEFGLRVFNSYVAIFDSFTNHRSVYQHHTMIVLEDSDLYAVIKYLKRSNHLDYLKHIWIHEEILSNTCDECTADIIKIISIWSEDIIGVKDFARSLNATVLCINAHMNFYSNTVIFPYSKLTELSIEIHIRNWTHYFLNDSTAVPHNPTELQSTKQYYNLYYNGMWQQPVKNTYWLYADKIYANATKYDFNRCINSAKKGFEIWSNMSIDVKSNILYDFVSALERAGDIALSCQISNWISSAALCNNSLTLLNASRTGEITTIYKPRGIMLLHEGSTFVLFQKLILTLMAGNTVIVLITRNSCTSVARYFNTFLISKIPSGVVNLLSSTMNLENIKSGFCMMPNTYKYGFDISNDEIFTTRDNVDEIYTNLTVPMCIILPFK